MTELTSPIPVPSDAMNAHSGDVADVADFLESNYDFEKIQSVTIEVNVDEPVVVTDIEMLDEVSK